MAQYLLIESRDPFDSNDVQNFYGLASGVKAAPLEIVIDQLAEGRKAIWH